MSEETATTTETAPTRVALVSGSSRGLGLEVARQLAEAGLRVVVTGRDGLAGKAAADKLASDGLEVLYRPLDIEREDSVHAVAEFLEAEPSLGRLDVLVNSAGLCRGLNAGEEAETAPTVLDAPEGALRGSLDAGCLGALRLTRALLPLMRRGGYGRIVNLSSRAGRLEGMDGRYPAYSLSMLALNALTRMLAAQLEGEPILVNAVDPGYKVAPPEGSREAPAPLAEAAAEVVWAASLPDDGPSGRLLRQRQAVDT
ncbi:SDR family NAD(P)-dependent oxidoreductase [Halorhodospira neutriphila]|uniref:Short-chain dehydrogenase/reductase SDR n=1 Tax=Halorhodospira neutriphila TaxID=168379 RepID=A0ABS1ED61_9GAMM|nr:SDR family NAD(P)-dependent oxidoreductase [Halorhodospira neutriphila]MBK1727644.1 hypothetical protein [Halorhodospira neutriphila]